jgi:uncharacterized membrane-anchored protein
MTRFSLALGIAALFVLSSIPAAARQSQRSEPDIDWEECPCEGDLGNAIVNVPGGLMFTGKAGARQFLELTGNIPKGNEAGIVLRQVEGEEPWFVIFSFDNIGYIKDDEKDSIDADELLSSIREGTEAANKEREKRGYPAVHVAGWQTKPFYDTETNNLTWAILGQGSDGKVVNHSVRVLGRRGVMKADLILSPELVDTAMPQFAELVSGFDFKAGNRYREFTKGDRVAEIGLTALIAGGAGAALVKSGALGKLWKLIVLGFVALVGAVKKLFARGKTQEPQTQAP